MQRSIRRTGWVLSAVAGAVLSTSATAAAQFTVIHQFIPISAPSPDPLFPNALVQGADGNLYGTSQGGGLQGLGTVYQMTPGGSVTVLHAFTGPDGANPTAPLIQARDGNFYGTTLGNNLSSVDGTVFRITPGGSFTTLHLFTRADGSAPWAGLVEGRDGFLYGTTQNGGEWDRGALYRISTAGDFTLLHSLNGGLEGGGSRAELIQGFDGNFYGTAGGGGAGNIGTVFRMTPAGDVTVLHAFAGGASDGSSPISALVQAIDGNFYGTTQAGGPGDFGLVFRLTPAGVFTILHAFTGGADGWHPSAPLVASSDQKLYGTTQFGPTAPALNGPGTVFSMTLSGTLTTLHQFAGDGDGQNPLSGMIHGSDGNFYGAVVSGGPAFGVVYRLTNTGACDDALRLSFSGGTLNLGFTLETAAPATWATWIATSTGSAQLWSISIPAVTPAASFTVPLAPFPHVGDVFVVSVLSSAGAVCADIKAVNTGS